MARCYVKYIIASLIIVPVLFHAAGTKGRLMLIDPDTIADAIAEAPAWSLVGLTVPSERVREDAARELATHLYRRLYEAPSAAQGQLRLPL